MIRACLQYTFWRQEFFNAGLQERKLLSFYYLSIGYTRGDFYCKGICRGTDEEAGKIEDKDLF